MTPEQVGAAGKEIIETLDKVAEARATKKLTYFIIGFLLLVGAIGKMIHDDNRRVNAENIKVLKDNAKFWENRYNECNEGSKDLIEENKKLYMGEDTQLKKINREVKKTQHMIENSQTKTPTP